MTLFGRYFWTSNYVNEQPKKFPTCHVRNISIYAPTRGATPIRDDLRQVQAISIHAPTRGATKQRWLKLFGGYISIHAPTRGATPDDYIIDHDYTDFNPRSYKRSDHTRPRKTYHWYSYFNPRSYKRSDIFYGRVPDECKISIHAPTRGATYQNGIPACLFDFNPRSYKRSDFLDAHMSVAK